MGKRKPIIHVSWKPIEPKPRFRKRRTVRWIERGKAEARRILDNFRSPLNRRGRARAFLQDLRAAVSLDDRIRAANYFGWFLMGVASGDARLDAFFETPQCLVCGGSRSVGLCPKCD